MENQENKKAWLVKYALTTGFVECDLVKTKKEVYKRIDSGIHYSKFEMLWEFIFELSEKYNCQIFATTHNHDCIDRFQESLKGKILCQFYDKESLKDVVDLNHRAN